MYVTSGSSYQNIWLLFCMNCAGIQTAYLAKFTHSHLQAGAHDSCSDTERTSFRVKFCIDITVLCKMWTWFTIPTQSYLCHKILFSLWENLCCHSVSLECEVIVNWIYYDPGDEGLQCEGRTACLIFSLSAYIEADLQAFSRPFSDTNICLELTNIDHP